jgi:GntR family transcriptional regulator
MSQNVVAFLTTPISNATRQPLRVAVYSRIADGIRSQIFAPGSLLPNEAELGGYMAVSRTVIREALMLLEEDGLITSRRGIGRFVTTRLPIAGLERLRPFEHVLSIPGVKTVVKRLSAELQTVSEYNAAGLKLKEDAKVWFWESVVFRNDEKIAIVQEHVPSGRELAELHPTLGAEIEHHRRSPTTMLSVLMSEAGSRLTQSKCEINVGILGASRGRVLDLKASECVLIMNELVFLGETPIYLAKCIVSTKAGHLFIMQSTQV